MITRKEFPHASADKPNHNHIVSFMHCSQCLREKPANKSPREWARLNVGWTRDGLQVWCVRHNLNVLHVDFGGQKHVADTTACVNPEHDHATSSCPCCKDVVGPCSQPH